MQSQKQIKDLEDIKSFYEEVYYKAAQKGGKANRHYSRLAKRLNVQPGYKVLDVACGLGDWLDACQQHGAIPYGVDLSEKAIQLCQETMPQGHFCAQPAETLPFPDNSFDLVTCLGSLEHFVDPVSALKEMVRTAKGGAAIVIVVPNADFFARKLRIYGGTHQKAAKEEPRSPQEWQKLFSQAGLSVIDVWSDLHMLSRDWISLRGPLWVLPRLVVALGLTLVPLRWQYQISYLCQSAQQQ